MEQKLKWYVLNYDFNKQKIEYYNIFNHAYLIESLQKILNNYTNFNDYIEQLDKLLRYCFWGKRECEISVGDAFETDLIKFKKIDIYFQLKPNIKLLGTYIKENLEY